jgi:hypothetical protein
LVNEDLENLDVAHAWYWFLKKRELGSYHPSMDPPTAAKSRTIEACMVKSHIFMNDFFCEKTWVLSGLPENTSWSSWTSLYQSGTCDKGYFSGEFYLRIEHRRFYQLYKRFMRDNYPASKPRNIDTVFKELEKIDVIRHPKRRLLNKRQKRVVDICFPFFKKKMTELYPTVQVNEWDSQTDQIGFRKMLLDRQVGAEWLDED